MANKVGILSILAAIFDIFRGPERRYTLLKNDPEKCEKSTKLGVDSIIWSIVSTAIVVLCAFGVRALLGNFLEFWESPDIDDFPFMNLLGAIICGAIIVYQFFRGFLVALMNMIYQFKLNKRGIRIASLVILLLCVVGSIVAVYLLLFAL